MVMDSETIKGSVDTEKTAFAQILNKNQWSYQGKMLS